MKISLKGTGIKALQNYIDGLVKKLDSLYSIISPYIEKDVLEHFEKEETPSGSKWLSLSPKYKEWKELHYPGLPMMVLKGTLKAGSINPIATKEESTIYFNTAPPIFAMFVGIKRRHFFGLSEKAGDLILRAIERKFNLD